MMDKNANDERLAAKQDLTELLVEILIPPFKSEICTTLEENLYPLERKILDKQERLEVQAGKVTRFIAKHYPEHSPPLEEQLQALQFAQQEAHERAHASSAELLAALAQHSAQAEAQQLAHAQALGALQAVDAAAQAQASEDHSALLMQLRTLNDSSGERLRDSLGTLLEELRGVDKEGLRRLEKFIVITFSQHRAAAQAVAAEQEARLQNAWTEQQGLLCSRHEASVRALAEVQHSLQAQQADVEVLKQHLDRGHTQLKTLLYVCAATLIANLGGLIYWAAVGH